MEKHAVEGGSALHELRELIRDGLVKHKAVDVERAAGTLVGHLVDMELVSEVWPSGGLRSFWRTPPLGEPR